MAAISVIGSLNMDLVVRTPKMPLAGETLAGSDFHIIPGGKGANQAVAAARAGAATRMIGCVGADPFGRELLDSLSLSGVDVEGVSISENSPTGTATIIVEDSGQNRIIIVPGANALVSEDYIEELWQSIEQSGLILLQHEIPLETVHYILARAKTAGIPVILNPAPVYDIPEDQLSLVHTLILNEIEAAALTSLEVTDAGSAHKAAQALNCRGVERVIITMGATGTVLVDSSYDLFQPAFKVESVDTTAAGDTFAGGYAACILGGKNPPEALLYAAAASALAVTRLGAQTSIPCKEEVQAFLALHAGETECVPITLKNGGV